MVSSTRARNRAAKVSVNGALPEKAKAMKINSSATLASALSALVSTHERDLWQRQSKSAICEYNRLVEKQGTFGDIARTF